MSRSPSLFTLLATTTLALTTQQALAHAHLVKSDPVAYAVVSAPKLIHLEFTESLTRKFSSFKLTDTDGNAVALTPVDSKDAKVLEATPNAALEPGLYTITWTAVSTEDGHKMTGNFSFTIK